MLDFFSFCFPKKNITKTSPLFFYYKKTFKKIGKKFLKRRQKIQKKIQLFFLSTNKYKKISNSYVGGGGNKTLNHF